MWSQFKHIIPIKLIAPKTMCTDIYMDSGVFVEGEREGEGEV